MTSLLITVYLVITVPTRFSFEQIKVPVPTLELCTEMRDKTRAHMPSNLHKVECKAETKIIESQTKAK